VGEDMNHRSFGINGVELLRTIYHNVDLYSIV
jgi:hypothetical protein